VESGRRVRTKNIAERDLPRRSDRKSRRSRRCPYDCCSAERCARQ